MLLDQHGKALKNPQQPSSNYSAYWPMGRQIDYRREVGDASGSGVVMAPVLWITRTFPEAPLVVERVSTTDDEDKRVVGHPLQKLIERPNEYYDSLTLWLATLVCWVIEGNAYWLKVRNVQKAVVGLWWAPNWTMTPRWPSDGSAFISHYDYTPNGIPIRVEVEDVVHLRHGIDPRNVRVGLSPLYSVFRDIFTDDESSRYTASILRNLGVPGIMVSPASNDVNIAPDEAEAMKAKIDERLTGENRGKALVFHGATKVDVVGFSPQQMDLSSLRDVSEERVCAALGVQAAVVGFGAGLSQTKVGATMKELVDLSWSGCLIPYQRIIASQLGHQLLPDFEASPDLFEVTFDRSKVQALQEDENARITRLNTQLSSGGFLVSEYRKALCLPFEKADEVYLRGLAIVEVPKGQMPLPDVAPAPAAAVPIPPKTRKVVPIRPTVKRATQLQRQVLARMTRAGRRLEASFRKELKGFFSELGAAAAAAAQAALKSSPTLRRAKNVGPRPGGPFSEEANSLLADAISRGMGIAEAMKRLREIFGAHYLRVFDDTVSGLGDVASITINAPDVVARQIISDGGTRAGLVDLEVQTRQRLFEELTEGREEGEGADALVRRIRDSIPAGPWSSVDIRAEVIARTETIHAQRASALSAYRAADNVTEVMLFDGRLPDSDEECQARDGEIVSFDEAQAAMDEEHPNGTLSFAPVVGDSARLAADALAAQGE